MFRSLAWLALVLPAAAVADDRPSAALFVRLDRNGDGYVTASEARGHRRMVAPFARIDRNRDQRLSRSEFYLYLARADRPPPDAQAGAPHAVAVAF